MQSARRFSHVERVLACSVANEQRTAVVAQSLSVLPLILFEWLGLASEGVVSWPLVW